MIQFKKLRQNKELLKCVMIPAFLLLCSPSKMISQITPETHQAKGHQKEQVLFPDEYSDLDDKPVSNQTSDKVILSTLEKSRQQYLMALSRIEKGDTVTAAKHFEQAINTLNKLVSLPGIEQNEEFVDLAQSIIEDYESFIQSIDNLDENTSLFIIRDKLYQEIEKYTASIAPQIKTIQVPVDSAAIAGYYSEYYTNTIPLDDNEYVQKNLSFLKDTKYGRKFIKDCLTRKSRWYPMISKIAKEEEVPIDLLYLAMIESCLNPNAVSKAKAVGMWQFIRSTGEDYGLNGSPSVWLDERRDPEKSTRAAMRHLKDLYLELGNWHLALAAYNCGINCVKRATIKIGVDKPTFWDLFPKLPKETRNYVPQFIATVRIILKPEAYGFDPDEIKPLPEYKYESFTLKEPVNFAALAKCAGISESELREYNPELTKAITPPDKSEYVLKLPVGSVQQFSAKFASLTPEEKMPWVYHTVLRGETLAKVAQEYNVSPKELASLNGLKISRSKLKKGSTLRIPIEQQDVAKDDGDDEQVAQNDQSSGTSGNGTQKTITHVVEKGETLFSIAQRYGMRLSDLRNLNNLSYDNDNISVGKELVISTNSAPKQDQPAVAAADSTKAEKEPVIEKIVQTKTVRHKVRSGETLAQIADNYGMTMKEIMDLNHLKKGKIFAGQILKLQSDGSVAKPKAEIVENLHARKVHKVKRGENLSNIAAKYGVTEEQLQQWNPNSIDGHTIYAGTKLKIYGEQVSKGSSSARAAKVDKAPKYYKIRNGDTLGKIAQKFGLSVASLQRKNKNIDPEKLIVGQKLRLQ